MEAYAGYYCNEQKLVESSSDGAATAVAEKIIEMDGIVYGAKYSEDFYSVHYGRATKVNELKAFRGSKYCYCEKKLYAFGEKKNVYESIIDDMSSGKNVLFIGLGCDIAGASAAIKKKDIQCNNLYLLELICDGVTSEIVQMEYVKWLENREKSRVIDFTVRYKAEGWGVPYIKAEFENGNQEIYPFYPSDYGFAFENLKKKSCYNCKFRGENHKGDIIVGDFWGCKEGMNIFNPNGTSLMIINTEKGLELLHLLDKKSFEYEKTDFDYAIEHNPRYYDSHKKYKYWNDLDEDIKRNGLRSAVRKHRELI